MGYDLDFTNSLVSVDAGVNFYLTSPTERATGTLVRVSNYYTVAQECSRVARPHW